MKEGEVPGVAIWIIKDGEVIFSEGFGYRDAKGNIQSLSMSLESGVEKIIFTRAPEKENE